MVLRTTAALTLVLAACSGEDSATKSESPPTFTGISSTNVFYVNQADSCASNTLCDGSVVRSASSDCGAVRPVCPFFDLTTSEVRQKTCLPDTTLAIAAGNYAVESRVVCGDTDANGLAVGADDSAIICQDWKAGAPTVWLEATLDNPPFDVITLFGKRSQLRGCGVKGEQDNNYLVNVTGGERTSFDEALLIERVYLKNSHRNDCLKGFEGSDYVDFSNSVVENCASQALDLTAVEYWKVHDSEFFSTDPAMPLDGAIGAKTGAKPLRKTATHIEFYANLVHDFSQGINLGGTGSDCQVFPDDLPCPLAATDLDVHDNTFTGSCGTYVVGMISCKDCKLTNNTIDVVGDKCVPVRFAVDPNKPASEGPVLTGNTITAENNAFLGHSAGAWSDAAPLVAGDNTYVSGKTPHEWIFAYEDKPGTFEEWKASTGTDETSKTSP